MRTKDVQRHLVAHGLLAPFDVDGIVGPQTRAALAAFKRAHGLNPRYYVGPLTRALLRGRKIRVTPKLAAGRTVPPWLRLARGYEGLTEIKGSQHARDIVGFWERLGLHFRDDETPWCAAFVNSMVVEAGYQIPRKYRAAALGWRWVGHGLRLPGPCLGAIMDMTRPGRPGSGHVTFVNGRDQNGMVLGLGGNQADRVGTNPYSPTARDARYYLPPGYPEPAAFGMDTLPLLSSRGQPLTNEA